MTQGGPPGPGTGMTPGDGLPGPETSMTPQETGIPRAGTGMNTGAAFRAGWGQASQQAVERVGSDADQPGDLLLRAGKAPYKTPGQDEECLPVQLMRGNDVMLILADDPDLLLHLLVRERDTLLLSMLLGDNGFQVIFPEPVEKGQAAAICRSSSSSSEVHGSLSRTYQAFNASKASWDMKSVFRFPAINRKCKGRKVGPGLHPVFHVARYGDLSVFTKRTRIIFKIGLAYMQKAVLFTTLKRFS